MQSEPNPLPAGFFAALLHPWTWRMAWRDSRTERARLLIFSLAIVSGIAALVAIHSLKSSVQNGIETQAKSLLGSDLQISSRQALDAADYQKLSAMAEQISRETAFPSMMKFPQGGARLVQIRGIEGEYPFYGQVETTPPDAWKRLPQESGVLLDPALLEQYKAKIGDEVELGSSRLKILGVVDKPAPRGSRFTAFAPEAYIRFSEIERSGLLGKNSLSSYQVYLKISDRTPSPDLKERIKILFPNNIWRLETPDDRRENLGDALDNFQQFLGILALASLILGAIGVAGAVHSHVTRRVPTVAILRCLGCPGNVAAAVYFVQAGALGLIGALLGAALGIGLQVGVLTFFRNSLPITVAPTPEWMAVLRTTAVGFSVCCCFAVLPLLKIQNISPAATLRGPLMVEGRTKRGLSI